MGLDHDGAAGGQGRGGVATEHREGEGEVAGREHGDRAQRHALAHHGRVAHGRRAGDGGVVDEGKGLASFGDVGEAAQLEGGAVEFAIEARRAEGGFFVGHRDQGFAVGFEGGSQGAQQGGAFGASAGGPAGKSFAGGHRGGIDLLGGGGHQRRAQGLARAGLDGLEGFHGGFEEVGGYSALMPAILITRVQRSSSLLTNWV